MVGLLHKEEKEMVDRDNQANAVDWEVCEVQEMLPVRPWLRLKVICRCDPGWNCHCHLRKLSRYIIMRHAIKRIRGWRTSAVPNAARIST